MLALFYSLAYSGLAVPYLLALIARPQATPRPCSSPLPPPATLTLAAVFLTGRRRQRPGLN